MKKILMVLLVLVALFSISAIDTKIIWNNDLYRFGVGTNNDDGMTGGVDIFVSDIDDFDIHFSGYSYTNRGFMDKGNLIQSRLDEMKLGYGFDFNVSSLTFDIEVGLSFLGNLGLYKLQNMIHDSMETYHLGLPYETDTSIAPYIDIDVKFEKTIGQVGDSNLLFYSDIIISASQFVSKVALSAGVALDDLAYFTLGYNKSTNDGGYDTGKVYTDMTSGVFFKFGLDAGGFGAGYTWYPSSEKNYGVGYIAINLLDFFKLNSYDETDLTVKTRMVYQYGRKGYGNEVLYRVNDFFSVALKENYSTGFPLSTNNNDPWNNYMFMRSNTLLTIDGAFDYSPCRWCSLYGEIGLGLGFYDFTKIDYNDEMTVKGASNTTRVISRTTKSALSGVVDLCGGMTLLPENLIASEHTSFQIDVFGGVSIVLNPNEVEYLLNWAKTPEWTLPDDFVFAPYYGIGITINLDI